MVPLLFLFADNLILFVGTRVERHAKQQIAKWAEGPPGPWGRQRVPMHSQAVAEWAARVGDVCDASCREEAGCFPSGERRK